MRAHATRSLTHSAHTQTHALRADSGSWQTAAFRSQVLCVTANIKTCLSTVEKPINTTRSNGHNSDFHQINIHLPTMAFKKLVKYGLPLSFVYCTVYQQNIWREGDEQLFEEQRTTWKKFFSLIDNAYHVTKSKLNLAPDSDENQLGFVSKFETLDFRRCWNANVRSAFATVDLVTSNPKLAACRFYRKIQPFVSNPHTRSDGEVQK